MMDATTRQALIAKYVEGCQVVSDALSGVTDPELDARPAPGKWSAREIVHHLADSEMTSAIRLRRLLAEERPVIHGYDQDAFATRLRYAGRDISPALDALRSARATTLQLLKSMSDEEWRAAGWHTEIGLYTAERWLEIYAEHAHGHAEQIRRLRAALSKS